MTTTRGKAELNVTPLIDVLLVLLIIFMVLTPGHSTGLPDDVPQERAPETPAQPNPLVVVVDVAANGDLRINDQPLARADLAAKLEWIFRSRAERVLFVSGDDEAEFGLIAGVIDVARSVDITHVALIKRKGM